MSEHWDFYFSRVNDVLASLFVDVGIRTSVPNPKKPCLLWMWLYFKQPRADGLSSKEESETLWAIEDAISEAVAPLGATLVGQITTAGRREMYFYGPSDQGWSEAVAESVGRFEGYQHDSGSQRDEAWNQYLNVLYPSARDRQRIKNRKVIEALEKEGDLLTKKREVSHWAYFPAKADRALFEKDVLARGFEVVDLGEHDDALNGRFSIRFKRIDAVDGDSINAVTLELLELAAKGHYDGWETPVVRDA